MAEKLVKQETGFTRIGDALIPCDATLNGDSSFDTPLIAKLGDTVFYFETHFDFDKGPEGDYIQLYVDVNKIKKGTVKKISYATGCGVCLYVQSEGDGERKEGRVQELFFHSYEEAVNVANKVNEYSFSHPYWEGDWYEIYKELFTPAYPHMLCFPVKPQEAWMVEPDGTRHIANRVVVWLTESKADVQYYGHDEKSYVDDRKLIEGIDSDWMGEETYRIIPRLQEHEVIIEC